MIPADREKETTASTRVILKSVQHSQTIDTNTSQWFPQIRTWSQRSRRNRRGSQAVHIKKYVEGKTSDLSNILRALLQNAYEILIFTNAPEKKDKPSSAVLKR